MRIVVLLLKLTVLIFLIYTLTYFSNITLFIYYLRIISYFISTLLIVYVLQYLYTIINIKLYLENCVTGEIKLYKSRKHFMHASDLPVEFRFGIFVNTATRQSTLDTIHNLITLLSFKLLMLVTSLGHIFKKFIMLRVTHVSTRDSFKFSNYFRPVKTSTPNEILLSPVFAALTLRAVA